MTHFGLYAGIRGFCIAFEAEGIVTVGVSEIDEDKNIVGNHWYPAVQNFGDIKDPDFSRRVLESVGRPDVLTGGVPCQPASALGQMRGTSDERWLWPRTIDVVGELRPSFGVFENPPSILVLENGRAWNGIVSGLAARGYDCWWDVLPAAAFGAGHLRERVILVIADSNHARLQGHAGHGSIDDQPGRHHAQSRGPVTQPDLRGRVNAADWWHEAHTGVPVLASGLSSRLVEASCRCVGDSIVPQVVMPIARAIRKTFDTLNASA